MQAHVVPYHMCESCSKLTTHITSIITRFQEIPAEQRSSLQVQYSEIDELIQGAEGGCHLCSRFMSSLYSLEDTGLVPNETEEEYEEPIYANVEERNWRENDTEEPRPLDRPGVYSLAIGKFGKVSRRLDALTDHLVIDYSGDLLNPAIEAQSSCFTGSEACFQMIKDWMHTCATQHASCEAFASLRRPTRLLDLLIDDTSDVRLVSGDTNNDPYAALSYSWGLPIQTMLFPTNHEHFKSRMSFSSLSNVVQDAITVCRGLSIRYLWIDALCIIQGPEGDFSQEAARMKDVYGGSAITIVAAATTDTTQHFLVHREALQLMNYALNAEINGHTGFVRNERLCHGTNLQPGDYHVDSRAWTMQERFLSPRSVYFGPTGIHWECRKGIACEFHVEIEDDRLHSRPAWYNSDEAKTNLKLEYINLMSLYDGQEDVDVVIAARKAWNVILTFYFTRALTHSTDKLVALSGVASLLESKTGLRASFGLWDGSFMEDLLWTVNLNTCYQAKFLDQAPSWSWANLGNCSLEQSYAHLLGENRGATICIQSSTAVLNAPPPDFGFERLPPPSTTATKLFIRGKLVPCGLHIDDLWDIHYYSLCPRLETTPSAIDTTFDVPIEELLQASHEPRLFTRSRETWPNKNDYHPDTLASVQQPDLFCLLVVSQLIHQYKEGVSRYCVLENYGLVLTPVEGGEHHYRRLGVFHETFENVHVEEDPEDEYRLWIPAEAAFLWKDVGEDTDVVIV
jgi:hypothetical protein